MDDELDPRLEAHLRAALHHAADALPLLVRVEDVERARRRRGGRRLVLPASLLAAAAVIAVLIATGVLWRGNPEQVAASPSIRASETALVGYDELLRMSGADTLPAEVIVRGEHPDAGPAGETVDISLGSLSDISWLAYGVHCLGGSIDLVLSQAGSEIGTSRLNCNLVPYGGMTPLSVRGDQTLPGPVDITVRADAQVRWRIVVAASGAAPSVISVPPVTSVPPVDGLATYERLAAFARSTRELARAEVLDGAVNSLRSLPQVAGHTDLEVAFDCVGDQIDISIVTGDGARSTPVGHTKCGTSGIGAFTSPGLDPTILGAPGVALRVVAPAGTTWRLIAYDHSADPKSVPSAPDLGFPSTLEGGYQGTLSSSEATNVMGSEATPGTTLAVAVDCTGTGVLHLEIDGVIHLAACPGPSVTEFIPTANAAPILDATADSPVDVILELRSYTREQTGAAFVAPLVEVTGGLVPRTAWTGWLEVFAIPGGASADESCGTRWVAVPEARAVRVAAGGTVQMALPKGWTMDRIALASIVTVDAIVPNQADPGTILDGWDGSNPAPSAVKVRALEVGDWTVRINVSGTSTDGATFTAAEYVRIIVEQ